MNDRPKSIPKLTNYKPTRFMEKDSHYDKKRADTAVNFIQNLKHTIGDWRGQRFWLFPWQEQIVRDCFGIIKKNGYRQFKTAYIEIPKKNGKSELAAAIALYLLYADGEQAPQVYSAAADRQQASIVFNVAFEMISMSPALMKRSNLLAATKRAVNYRNAGFYQVLSAEVGTKNGFNISGLVFDEVHAQKTRQLYDILTKGSGDARKQPFFFLITTAGTDKHSVCYELHQKAEAVLNGQKIDPKFYPVIYGLRDGEDWHDSKNWYKANPSLGLTIDIDTVQGAYADAIDNPADEARFKQLRLNMWVSSTTSFIPEQVFDLGSKPIDMAALEGRECYGGLDLSSTGDITALSLVFRPEDDSDDYKLLSYYWIPEDTIPLRVRRASVPYDVWKAQGKMYATPGNVIDYGYIRAFINNLKTTYNIKEIAVDRWNATELIQDLEGDGFTMVPFGQGFKDMSPATKEFYKLLMQGKIRHGGDPVLKWMALNVVVDRDAAENIKPTKARSPEKIDGIVTSIMALDRAIRHETKDSVYNSRGILTL